MSNLESRLEDAFNGLRISQENRYSLNNHLNLLKIKDEATYEHSIRVGILASEIADYIHFDPKVLFFSGILHDVGKVLIAPEILKKTKDFGEKDMKEMKKHVLYSYKILRGVHEFSAEIVLRHHKYQEGGYPKKLPETSMPFSYSSKTMIDFFGRILSLADFYDAITSRNNEKFGKNKMLDRQAIKSIILDKNPDQKYLIEELYAKGIFGK